MKTIEPIQIWQNGSMVTAKVLTAFASNVILGQSASFSYSLMGDNIMTVAQGYLNMSGADYQAWNNDDVAWDWIAKQLNITITGDWNPPTPTPAV